MRKWIIALMLVVLAAISLAAYSSHRNKQAGEAFSDAQKQEEANRQNAEAERKQAFGYKLKLKADTALAYCQAQKLNTEYCYLVDFSVHSGKHRFFIWSFAGDSVVASTLCAHGYGRGSTTSKPVFSNVEGSYCSSLGRYKTGARSYSNWGINVHYKLHGLDKTNSNAFKRWVVLHSHTPIKPGEIYPRHLPLGYSQGCPVINDEVMRKIDTMLKQAKAPVLLWIYN